jgi:AcrR family transcriptional regulator
MASYRTPPQRLRRPRARSGSTASLRYVAHDQRERILDALAVSVAEKGYPAVTVADIARTAATSLSTFYAHFANKEEAFLGALDSIKTQSIEASLPAYSGASDWPQAVRAGLRALIDYIAVQPAWAHLGLVAVYAAGPRALALNDDLGVAFQGALGPGYERSPTTPPIAAEAISGATYALMSDHVRARGAERLGAIVPMATFLSLAPFIGTDAACAVANESDDSRRLSRAARGQERP